MNFKLSFGMSVGDEMLLEIINDRQKDCGDEPYGCLDEVPENEILDTLYDEGYIDTAIENVMLEEINIKKL